MEKSIEALDAEDVADLCDSRVEERQRLDYKATIPGGSDAEKREFLADVTSFANTAGGALIYGVSEEDGVPTGIAGLQGNPDQAVLRLEQMLRSGVQPRIAHQEARAIRLDDGGFVVVVRVRRSWNAPHMVQVRESQRFYARGSNGRYLLDVQQLREAFAGSERMADRVRDFRLQRLADVRAGLPIELDPKAAKLVLHLVPASAVDRLSRHVDLAPLFTGPAPLPLYGGTADSRPNFDGFVSLGGGVPPSGYAQCFRTGAIEAVSARAVRDLPSRPDQPQLVAPLQGIADRARHYLDHMRGWGVELPVFATVSLLGVKGAWILPGIEFGDGHPIDRDDLLVPEVVIDAFDADLTEVLRPTVDAIWQAAGWSAAMETKR